MNKAQPSSDWKLLNGRIDEVFGVLDRIQALAESGNTAETCTYIKHRLDEIAGAITTMRVGLETDDSGDRWNHLNRRVDELFSVLHALRSESKGPGAPSEVMASDRGLFVIGHARSGTTILADALNSADDVCCLMEPYLYRSIDLPNFADSFNRMHQRFGNAPIKGYWIPGFGGATGRVVLGYLRTTHRYVGEKLAFFLLNDDSATEKFLEFAVEEFYKSPFICVVRDPIKVTSSVIYMFESSDFSRETIAKVVKSQLETYLLILRLSLIVPSFYLLVHENVGDDTLAALGSHLSIDLERTKGLYSDNFKVAPHAAENERIVAEDSSVQSLQEVFYRVKDLVDTGSVKIRSDKYLECRKICEAILILVSPLAATRGLPGTE